MNGWLMRMLAVLMVGSFGFAVWSLNESHNAVQARVRDQAALNAERAHRAAKDRQILCRATNRSNKALRSVLSLAAAGVLREPFIQALTRQQATEYRRAYMRALRLTRPVDCSQLDPPRKEAHVVFD